LNRRTTIRSKCKRSTMSEPTSLKDPLEDEIKDLYSAEKQLTKAIPKMAKGSNDPELEAAFRSHLKETEGQVTRLEKVAEILETKPTGKKCMGMEGVIEEGAEGLDEDGDPNVLDLGIIGAGSRVEHYEIAGYMTAISLAEQLGETDVVKLLNASLAEEEAAEEKLRSIAKQILKAASAAEAEGKPKDQTLLKTLKAKVAGRS
jgi:ferritin-like metal-binding protein YciE